MKCPVLGNGCRRCDKKNHFENKCKVKGGVAHVSQLSEHIEQTLNHYTFEQFKN